MFIVIIPFPTTNAAEPRRSYNEACKDTCQYLHMKTEKCYLHNMQSPIIGQPRKNLERRPNTSFNSTETFTISFLSLKVILYISTIYLKHSYELPLLFKVIHTSIREPSPISSQRTKISIWINEYSILSNHHDATTSLTLICMCVSLGFCFKFFGLGTIIIKGFQPSNSQSSIQ